MIQTLALIQWDNPATYYYLWIVLFAAYLLGSIPFGLIFGWLAGAGDIRKQGSGNIGATNVLRTGSRWAAMATLLCDVAKGYIAVRVAGEYFGIQLYPVTAGFGALLGHLFPIWLGFRGGKGVATFLGITAAFAPPVALLTCASWLAAAWAFRRSSLAALIAIAMTPLYFLLVGASLFALLTFVLAILIFIAHRANIMRLVSNKEPKIGAS